MKKQPSCRLGPALSTRFATARYILKGSSCPLPSRDDATPGSRASHTSRLMRGRPHADDSAGSRKGAGASGQPQERGTMASMNENERMEYTVLMSRGRDAERTSHFCWIASGIAATILLSWGMAAKNPALMLPVIFVVAYGFYTMVHGRQQTRLIGGYVKEFFECDSGPQWFTRLGHLEIV